MWMSSDPTDNYGESVWIAFTPPLTDLSALAIAAAQAGLNWNLLKYQLGPEV